MKLPVILIHGIGGSTEKWADPIIESLDVKVLAELKGLLKDKAPKDVSDVLVVRSVYWKTALEPAQRSLREVLAGYFKIVAGSLNPFENLFRRVYKNIYALQSTIVPLFIGDIIGYMEETGKSNIYEKVVPILKELEPAAGEKEAPLTIISHSLGTVISSNYVFDKMDEQRQLGLNRMDPRFILMNFFTAGSPIALFSMKFGGPEHFDLPISVEDPNGRWINFLDKDDPVAMPLRPINVAHAHAVHNDYLVETGWLNTAHTDYFKKPDTLNLIARKLAIDWIRANEKADAATLQKLQSDFDLTAAKRSLSK